MKTLEMNTNNEWLIQRSPFDFDDIDELERDDAADDFHCNLWTLLEDSGFEVTHPGLNRSSCSQWDGVRLFKHKIMCIGTFDDLTDHEVDVIYDILDAVAQKTHELWKKEDTKAAD